MMLVIREFFKGIVSVLTVMPSPLYRYPYRNSAEAFRGDWSRIGKDISYVFEETKQGESTDDE
ncbi:MAG: hypothetical protein MK052_05605 [Alphaproteobacteria bacterium]|nr:hypothetical protein [Alphaproteobacteria bacterium]